MFEFDEHFAELEVLESGLVFSECEEQGMLPSWSYVGSDVWKLDLDIDSLEIAQEWRLQTVDMA
jgi:hypothetical protein